MKKSEKAIPKFGAHFYQSFFNKDSSIYGNIRVCEEFLIDLYFKATSFVSIEVK